MEIVVWLLSVHFLQLYFYNSVWFVTIFRFSSFSQYRNPTVYRLHAMLFAFVTCSTKFPLLAQLETLIWTKFETFSNEHWAYILSSRFSICIPIRECMCACMCMRVCACVCMVIPLNMHFSQFSLSSLFSMFSSFRNVKEYFIFHIPIVKLICQPPSLCIFVST